MALITNGLVTIVCVFGFIKAKRLSLLSWKIFFLTFGFASFFGAWSHIFWNYWGFLGKITPWFFGVVSSAFLVVAIVELFNFSEKTKKILKAILVFKSIAILILAYSYWNFLFVAIDTILSLFIACGIGSFVLYFHYNKKEYISLLLGFLIILPSALIFILKFDAHLWLNREDLSHILIAFGLLFFVHNLTRVASSNSSKS